MMVERLTVCYIDGYTAAVQADVADRRRLGVEHGAVQDCPRGHEDLDQDLDIINDGSAETTQVPTTALRDVDEALR